MTNIWTVPPGTSFKIKITAVGGGGGGGGTTINAPKPIIEVISLKQQKIRRGSAEGYECMECQDFFPMAELNMPEGSPDCNAFKCYSCRRGLNLFYKKEKKDE